MLEEQYVLDQIEIKRDGTLQVRHATIILKDGEPYGNPIYHRHCKTPGEDVVAEHDEVKAVAAAIWTTDKIDAYNEKMAALKSKMPNQGKAVGLPS